MREKNQSSDRDAVKLRGGYYTPADVAKWLCNWAIKNRTDRVLEPSSGDGVFLQESCNRLGTLGASAEQALRQVNGVEVAAGEVAKARARLRNLLGQNPNGTVTRGDFFKWTQKNRAARFDCVVGNPPFIRYQNFPEPARSLGMQLLLERGLKANRLTNAWVPFVVAAAGALSEGGRMALVLPAELLQVTYAAQLRMFLAGHFRSIHIFACNHLLFERAEQEVLLLMADGYTGTPTAQQHCQIQLSQIDPTDDIRGLRPQPPAATNDNPLDHSTEKWLKYFLDSPEIGLMRSLRESKDVTSLEAFASIDVGVVTGRNQFFVLDKRTIEEWNLADQAMPLVGRSSQLKGAQLSRREWAQLAAGGERMFLLMLADEQPRPLSQSARNYVEWGELHNAHVGYKCRIREPWYTVPSVWVPDCFLFRQIHDFPRVVVNRAAATSTDTIHRMRCKVSRQRIATNLYTHLAAASAEIEGRSYGGGVLELEPGEAERLLVPRRLQIGLPLAEVDSLIRAGRLRDVLRENDRLILKRIGLSAGECRMLERIWVKMRDRRHQRRRSKTAGKHPVASSVSSSV